MIPIIKNIIVTDDLGREHEPTYLRRAKGLIKKGRARWANDSDMIICLTCPPQYEVEDFKMENNLNEDSTLNQSFQLNIEYILNKINQITSDNEHIHGALKSLNDMPVSQPHDYSGQAKADAISKIVSSRETTNQQLIKFMEKMYDDIKPRELV